MSFSLSEVSSSDAFIQKLNALPSLFSQPLSEQPSYDARPRIQELLGADAARIEALYEQAQPRHLTPVTQGEVLRLLMGPASTNNARDITFIKKVEEFYTQAQAVVRAAKPVTEQDKADLIGFQHTQRKMAHELMQTLVRSMDTQKGVAEAHPAMQALLPKIIGLRNSVKSLQAQLTEPGVAALEEAAQIYEKNNLPYPAMQMYLSAFGEQADLIAADKSTDVALLKRLSDKFKEVEATGFSNPARPAKGFHQNFAGITAGEPLGTVDLRQCVTLLFTAKNGDTLGVHISKRSDLSKLAGYLDKLQGPLEVSVVGASKYQDVTDSAENLKKVYEFLQGNKPLASRCTFIKANIGTAMRVKQFVYDPKTKTATFERPQMASEGCAELINNLIHHTAEINLSFDTRSGCDKGFPVKMPDVLLKEHDQYASLSPVDRVKKMHHVILSHAAADLAAHKDRGWTAHMLNMMHDLEALSVTRKAVQDVFPAWMEDKPMPALVKSKAVEEVGKAVRKIPIYFGENADIANAPLVDILANPDKRWVRNNEAERLSKGQFARVTNSSAFDAVKLMAQAKIVMPPSGADAVLKAHEKEKAGVGSKPSPLGKKEGE